MGEENTLYIDRSLLYKLGQTFELRTPEAKPRAFSRKLRRRRRALPFANAPFTAHPRRARIASSAHASTYYTFPAWGESFTSCVQVLAIANDAAHPRVVGEQLRRCEWSTRGRGNSFYAYTSRLPGYQNGVPEHRSSSQPTAPAAYTHRLCTPRTARRRNPRITAKRKRGRRVMPNGHFAAREASRAYVYCVACPCITCVAYTGMP